MEVKFLPSNNGHIREQLLVLPHLETPAGEVSDEAPGSTIDGAGLTPTTKLRPPGLLELEELLAEHLQTRVSVSLGAKRGKIVVEFADLEDLERIYRVMSP